VVAQDMNKLPRFFTCYPPGIAAAGSDFAIQGTGQFDRYKRISSAVVFEEGFIELARFVLQRPGREFGPQLSRTPV